MFSFENLYKCGKILKPHGNDGSLKVTFDPLLKHTYNKGNWLLIKIQEKPVPFFIESVKYFTEEQAFVKLEDVNSPEMAQKFIHCEVMESVEQLNISENAPLDPSILKGFMLYDNDGKLLGEITEVLNTPGQFLLEIKKTREQGSFLVPFHDVLVKEVSPEGKTLVMEIPEGLEEA